MLAFDIETTGLDPRYAVVTCICAEDFHTGARYAFEYARIRKESPEELDDLTVKLVELFNNSSSLCAFNGIQFDLPFMKTALCIPQETIKQWASKTSDILQMCRKEYKHTFKLDLLCEVNEIATKTSSGLEAIQMAKRMEWHALKSYCEQDVNILCVLYRKRYLINPRTRVTMDLIKWSHVDVYSEREDKELEHTMEECDTVDIAYTDVADSCGLLQNKERLPICKYEDAFARRIERLCVVDVRLNDIFGVEKQYCVTLCPVCDREGFIQEDTQMIQSTGVNPGNSYTIDNVFSCGMQHAYRIRVGHV